MTQIAPLSPLILVVEDSPNLQAMAMDLLEITGYRVIVADRVNSAIASFEQAKPDLVLADLRLADDSGLVLLAHIRAHPTASATPVVLMSGDRQQNAGIQNADAFIDKPFDPDALLETVAGLIQRHAIG